MRLVGNILWLLLGGLEMAVGYLIAGLVMFLMIVTIPFGFQAFKLASFSVWPFGRTLIRREEAGAGSVVGNVLWFVLAGWWLALGHLIVAGILAITIIGIPFAVAHLKLAGTALWPFGREIVPITSGAGRADSVVVTGPSRRPGGDPTIR